MTGDTPTMNAIDKFTKLTGDQKVSLLSRLIFSGMPPADFFVASVLIILPERSEELLAEAERLIANPSAIPPLFPKQP